MKNKERLDLAYESETIDAAVDEIKFMLLKLQIQFHDTLNKTEKKLIEECVPKKYKDFDTMVNEAKESMKREDKHEEMS